jgi:hypothetical protein
MPNVKVILIAVAALLILGIILFFAIANPLQGTLSEWTEWSKCTPLCGDTCYETRTRTYTPPMLGESHPEGYDVLSESRKVIGEQCPVDGKLSEWNQWTGCEQTKCGSCEETRNRTYTAPMHGGKHVEGYDLLEQKQMATLPQCPINGVLSEWGAWTGCETTKCGRCEEKRTRNYTPPLHGGEHPVGHDVLSESRDAKKLECAVTLYTSVNYKGASSTLPVGEYDTKDLGIPGDSLRSLKVTPRHRVELFDNDRLKGPLRAFTSDTRDLGDLKSRTGSIRVTKMYGVEK